MAKVTPRSDRATRIAREYVEGARHEFSQRIKAWRVDLSQQEVHEVVGALLARQVALATELAGCPHMWTPHVAPVLLRAMADVYISSAWILGSPVDRSQKFIAYGLGQVKLQAEHRKLEIERRGENPKEDQGIAQLEAWAESQRWLFLTEVNLANWSGLTTREMADQAGCIDFYNLVYGPFSAAAHSTWHHVSRANLEVCSNPLHRYHRVATALLLPPDPYNLVLAAKYLDKTFRLFDEKTGVTVGDRSAYKRLDESLRRIGKQRRSSKPHASEVRKRRSSPKAKKKSGHESEARR